MLPTDWLPFAADLPPLRRPLQGPALASQPPYAPAIFPVPDLLAAETFQARYPDRVPRPRLPREPPGVQTAPLGLVGAAPVSWAPRYPDRVPARRPVTAPPVWTDATLGAAFVIAQRLAWDGHSTLLRPTARATVLPFPGATLVRPLLPLSLLPVLFVDMGLDVFGQPTLARATLTAPTLLGGQGGDQPLITPGGLLMQPPIYPIDEEESGQYTATVTGNDGVTPLPVLQILTLTLTVYVVKQDGTEQIINGRNQQNVLNANNVLVDVGGGLTWTIQPGDTTLVEAIPYETHFALFEWTFAEGQGKHLIAVRVRNLRRVP